MKNRWPFFGKKRRDYPEFWQKYLATFDSSDSWRKQPIDETLFVVFDTETTGLDLHSTQLLSIGAVKLYGSHISIADSLDIFVGHADQPDTSAIPIHGILKNVSRRGLAETEAIVRFLHFCQNAVLVGHNVQFDIAMINRSISTILPDQLKNKKIDTSRLALRLEQFNIHAPFSPEEYSLDALCQRYNILTNDRHTAAGDAYLTALLLVKLLSRLKKRGVNRLGELLK